MKVAPLLFVLLLGCSSGSGSTSLDGGSSGSSSKCDAIADDIRQAATKRGYSGSDVCADTTPAIQKDFASACANLAACKADGG
jgi:hypothetical protein